MMRPSKRSATPRFPRNLGNSTTSWTIPRPTDVLAYSYLWHREAQQGREEGTKDRPVVVVVAREKRSHGTELLVVPVTTRQPRALGAAVEMPERVRAHLGLGDARCWIITDELNRFTWPGPDIRPIRDGSGINPRYGSIPGKLFEQVRRRLEQAAQTATLKVTRRTE